jgi:hypothetical protein
MTSATCGYCGTVAQMHGTSNVQVTPDGGAWGIVQAAFACEHCNRLSVGSVRTAIAGKPTAYSFGQYTADWQNAQWMPKFGAVKEFPDVPEHIAEAASEATLCLSSGAYRAVGSLARAVIEATAKDKGITKGDLATKIDALEAGDFIRPHTKEVAHEIRHFGNTMAHGDFADPVTQEEAEEIITLMSEVLSEVYQAPALLDRVQAARKAKKGSTTP